WSRYRMTSKVQRQSWISGTRLPVATVALALAVLPVLTMMVSLSAHAQTQYQVLYSFTGGTDGQSPADGALVRDPVGNLYGTTYYGGTSNMGTVFELNVAGTETILRNFAGGADGAYPWAGLVLDAKGNLYGTTYQGGTSNEGMVFAVSKTGAEK